MAGEFPFEDYLKALQYKNQAPMRNLQQVSDIGTTLGNVGQKMQKSSLEQQKIMSDTFQKIISAGYEPMIGEQPAPASAVMELLNGKNPKEIQGLTFKKAPIQPTYMVNAQGVGVPVTTPTGENIPKTAKTLMSQEVPIMTFNPFEKDVSKQYTNTGLKAPKGTVIRQEQMSPGERAAGQAGENLIPPSEAGRATLAQQSMKNIEDVKNLLFPGGTVESFDKNLALKSKLPFFGRAMPNDQQAQQLFRKMSDSLGGKVLIQTGVAARPEEVTAEYKKFYANYFSDPKATYDGLTQLQDFYRNFLNTLTTRKLSPESQIQSNPTISQPQPNISEEDIQFTMKKYNVSRDEVLKRIGAK